MQVGWPSPDWSTHIDFLAIWVKTTSKYQKVVQNCQKMGKIWGPKKGYLSKKWLKRTKIDVWCIKNGCSTKIIVWTKLSVVNLLFLLKFVLARAHVMWIFQILLQSNIHVTSIHSTASQAPRQCECNFSEFSKEQIFICQ